MPHAPRAPRAFAQVRVLSTLPELRVMNLSQNGGVTDRCVPLLAALPVLESLNLSNTNVGAGALPALQRLVALTSLALYACALPPAAAGALRTHLPRLLTLGIDAPNE